MIHVMFSLQVSPNFLSSLVLIVKFSFSIITVSVIFVFELAKRDQLQVLQTYKDKEYPAKALKIAELQKEIDLFNIANREDKSELEVKQSSFLY